MMESTQRGIITTIFTLILCSQTSALLSCQQQCLVTRVWYARIISSQVYLDSLYNYCISQCPPEPTTTTTTTTTTTPPTTTTTTTTEAPSTAPSGPSCGTQYRITPESRYRVVGGESASECEYPWMVGVSIDTHFCGGSILDSRHILTAAHCVRDKRLGTTTQPWQIRVRAGSSNILTAGQHLVSKVSVHPSYGDTYGNYDVAVLTLTKDLIYTDCVLPICLPNAWENPEDADFCVVAGWGLQSQDRSLTGINPELQEVKIPIVDRQRCRQSYDAVYGPGYVSELKVCAGDFENGGIDACQRDSGGPLMCKKNNHYVVHGIVSSGNGCGLAGFPGIYTRVAHMNILDFIKKAMETS